MSDRTVPRLLTLVALFGAFGLGLGGLGCGDKSAPSGAAAHAIPVEEDFDEESEKEITADNFEAQLDALAKEIEAGN